MRIVREREMQRIWKLEGDIHEGAL